jgi:hypothetical protein
LKTFIISLLFGCVVLFAQSASIEKKIYTHILHSLYPQSKGIKVWADTQSKREMLQGIPKVKIVTKPEDADFILVQKKKDLNTKGLIFATDYHTLEHYKKSAIGGFYWQKGRPNILFLKPNLIKHRITLPKEMQEYIEDTL